MIDHRLFLLQLSVVVFTEWFGVIQENFLVYQIYIHLFLPLSCWVVKL